MDTVASYFVRSRGRITGPFDVAALELLAQRGQLTRFDHLSIDQQAWSPAGEMPALFAPKRRGLAPVRSTRDQVATDEDNDRGPVPLTDERLPARAAPQKVARFHYVRDGRVEGPISLNGLRSLVRDGALRAEDEIRADGSDIGTAAWQTPMLSDLFGRGVPQGTTQTLEAELHTRRRDVVPISVREVQLGARVTYLVAAGLMLVFGLLPILIVGGRPVWWWDVNAWMTTLSTYGLVAALALMIVAPLTANLVRPMIALPLVAFPTLVALLVGMLQSINMGGVAILAALGAWGTIVLPLVLTVLNRMRTALKKGGPASIRAAQIVVGALLVLSQVAGGIALADGFSAGSARWTFVAAKLAMVAAIVANGVGGILAMVAGKPRFMLSLCTTSTALVLVGSLLFVASGAMTIAGVRVGAVLDANASAIAFALLRNVVLVTCAAAWLSGAINELLAWLYRREAIDAR